MKTPIQEVDWQQEKENPWFGKRGSGAWEVAMSLEKHSLHQRLQEYCHCYSGTDPREELDRLSSFGITSDSLGDTEEVAIKLLGLMILYGLRESASLVELWRDPSGQTRLEVQATGKYRLPAPGARLVDKAFKVMRAITYLEGDKASEPLSLGLGGDSLSLEVGFEKSGDWEALRIRLPRV